MAALRSMRPLVVFHVAGSMLQASKAGELTEAAPATQPPLLHALRLLLRTAPPACCRDVSCCRDTAALLAAAGRRGCYRQRPPAAAGRHVVVL